MAASGAPDYTSALYAFVVMAYATLAVAQYTKNGTTQKIKDQKLRAEKLWEKEFVHLRENADLCPNVRKQLDMINLTEEQMRDRPLYWLYGAVAFAALLHLWNIIVVVFGLDGNMMQWLGLTVFVAYTVLAYVILWIGYELKILIHTAQKIRQEVDSWKGAAEFGLDTVLRTAKMINDAAKNAEKPIE